MAKGGTKAKASQALQDCTYTDFTASVGSAEPRRLVGLDSQVDAASRTDLLVLLESLLEKQQPPLFCQDILTREVPEGFPRHSEDILGNARQLPQFPKGLAGICICQEAPAAPDSLIQSSKINSKHLCMLDQ